MPVYVLLYDPGTENEGIHSLEIQGKTVVLMFENRDDAVRYCGLLEAQDFPKPEIEVQDREEIEMFCKEAGYEARFVENGFIPKNEEERLMLSPPESNRDVSNWSNIDDNKIPNDEYLEEIKKKLEGLL